MKANDPKKLNKINKTSRQSWGEAEDHMDPGIKPSAIGLKNASKGKKPDAQKPKSNRPGVHTHSHSPKGKKSGQVMTAGTKVKGAGLATKKTRALRY